jgi:CubicO group peptidase (beta-lactamase class C family)
MVRRYPLVVALWLSLLGANASAATGVENSDAAAAAEMNRILSDAFHSDAPGAAVLVVHKGEVVLRKGYGLADLELGVPIDPTHVFRIGSMTKQFTAVAVLQLVEAGKLRLDDQITQYVPDYPVGGNKVTLSQLLTHTSGIPSIEAQPEWLQSWRQDMTVPQLLAFTKDKPFDFPPGTDWKYSNTGYIVLGATIEKASGQSYADYIQTHIFAPADMTNSSYGSESRVIRGRIPGYSRDGKGWANAPYFSMTQPFSAGGLLSNVDDLWKWEQALAAGKLVSPALLAEAYKPVQLPDGRAAGYGFGWQVGTLGKHPTVEHGGSIQGFSSYELRVADEGFYMAILCNTESPAVSPHTMAERIARLALNEPEQAAAANDIVNPELHDFVGDYLISAGGTLKIILEDGKLVGQIGGGRRPLAASATDEFSTPGNEMRLTFLRDSAHHVDRTWVRGDGPGPGQIWPRTK